MHLDHLVAAFLVLALLACGDDSVELDAPAPKADRVEESDALAEVEDPGGPASDEPGPDDDESEHEGPGRWHDAATDLTEEQMAEIAHLQAIGYVSGSTVAGKLSGVTRHDPERAVDGLNFYTSGHHSGAILMDMQGRPLHQWECTIDQAWPEVKPGRHTDFWRRAILLPNGDVIAIFEGHGMIRLDRDSRLLWKNEGGAHHQLELQPDGLLYVLTRTSRLAPRINEQTPILEDFVSIVDPDTGVESRRVSILRCLQRSPFYRVWKDAISRGRDIFHTNTLKVLDGRHVERLPDFAKGNVLVSMRSLDAIAVLDIEDARVVWFQTGTFRRQHDPTLLENGHILLFDNRGRGEASSLQEIDPATSEIVWNYRGTEDAPFYSRSCGTAHRFANGNTLVSETDRGRAFEITADKEIVWEFYSPHRAGDEGQYVASLFEVVRLPLDFGDDWVELPDE